MDLFQGPKAPWCVGSVFGAADSTNSYGPLLFDPVDRADEWLDTGCRLNLFDEQFVHPKKQMDFLSEDPTIQYCGSLANDLLMEDVVMKLGMVHDSNYVLGNRLQALECSDGKLQLVFPVGENFNSIGSILCEPDASGRWCPVKKNESEPDARWLGGVRMSVSSSLRHPIRQLSVAKSPASLQDESIILARTPYQLHVSYAHREDDKVCFASSSVKTYRTGVAHVTWNPLMHGEFATVLETGEVLIYDLQSSRTFTDNLRESFVVRATSNPITASAQGSGFSGSLLSQLNQLQTSWWRSEFGWHPRVLMIANSQEISLHDMRAGQTQLTQLSTIQELKNYCHSRSNDQRFVALTRSDDTSYHFATATCQHILLYDVRRPRTPVVEWEHKMQDDAPGFLSILPLSSLRPGKKYGATSAEGRVIMASSFRSGDVRCFSYGPQAPAGIISGASTRFRDTEDSYCAWQFPSKLYTSQLRDDCWIDLYRASATVLTKRDGAYNALEGVDCLESLSGVAVVADAANQEGFNLLQLTGAGKISAQRYAAAEKSGMKEPKTPEPPQGLLDRLPTTLSRVNLFGLQNYVMHGVICSQDYQGSLTTRPKRRRKTVLESQRENYRELIYQALREIDIFVSNYELAVKVLLASLPETLARQGSAMPSDVSGLIKKTNRLPYVRPLMKLRKRERTLIPLPLPVLLEKDNAIKATADAPHNYFRTACELVEEVTSDLKHKQEQEVISLHDGEPLEKKLLFHTSNNTYASRSRDVPDTEGRPSPSKADSRFQSFIALKPTPSEKSDTFGRPVIDLKFKIRDVYEPQELSGLARLQQDFEKWQEGYTPFTDYCDRKKMLQ